MPNTTASRGTVHAFLARKGFPEKRPFRDLPCTVFWSGFAYAELWVASEIPCSWIFDTSFPPLVRSIWLTVDVWRAISSLVVWWRSVTVNLYLWHKSDFSVHYECAFVRCTTWTLSTFDLTWSHTDDPVEPLCQTLSISGARRSCDCIPWRKHFRLVIYIFIVSSHWQGRCSAWPETLPRCF